MAHHAADHTAGTVASAETPPRHACTRLAAHAYLRDDAACTECGYQPPRSQAMTANQQIRAAGLAAACELFAGSADELLDGIQDTADLFAAYIRDGARFQ